MRLPNVELELSQELQEFDKWITPSLGEIRDTLRFRQELDRVETVFATAGKATSNFARVEDCDPVAIADAFEKAAAAKDESGAKDLLQALAAVLFLVTGKSDNNAKCQLPIYLQQTLGWTTYPVTRRSRGRSYLASRAIPRVLKAENYMANVAALRGYPADARRLLEEFTRFVLSDEAYVSQLWAVGHAYFSLREIGTGREMLAPLVAFQVRGSVAASGGHDPEALLRNRLRERWGLLPEVDYNLTDAVLASEAGAVAVEEDVPEFREKSRAYDFLLPYKTGGWRPKIFVQCQFYAGDSGSVSHKNVDQTTTSRESVLRLEEDACFLEYVDGAGYFASLNGDLKTLLSMPTTKTFFQVRSADIRLRRELQEVGFLTPLEVQQAALLNEATVEAVTQSLLADGYSMGEIDRCITQGRAEGWVDEQAGTITLSDERRAVVRRYCLLDIVAAAGTAPAIEAVPDVAGSMLVPGYGPYHGLRLSELPGQLEKWAPVVAREDWSSTQILLEDVQWLCAEGAAMMA